MHISFDSLFGYFRIALQSHSCCNYCFRPSRLGIINASIASALTAPSVNYCFRPSRLGIINASIASALTAPSVAPSEAPRNYLKNTSQIFRSYYLTIT